MPILAFSARIIKLTDPRKIHGKQRIWWNRRGMNEKKEGRVISNTLLLSEIDEWKSKLGIFYSKLMLLLEFYIRYSHKCVVIGWGC